MYPFALWSISQPKQFITFTNIVSLYCLILKQAVCSRCRGPGGNEFLKPNNTHVATSLQNKALARGLRVHAQGRMSPEMRPPKARPPSNRRFSLPAPTPEPPSAKSAGRPWASTVPFPAMWHFHILSPSSLDRPSPAERCVPDAPHSKATVSREGTVPKGASRRLLCRHRCFLGWGMERGGCGGGDPLRPPSPFTGNHS